MDGSSAEVAERTNEKTHANRTRKHTRKGRQIKGREEH
jgi:hypothetical protein